MGVKAQMWEHLNSLIDPVFFGRCCFFIPAAPSDAFARFASCDVWHLSKDKRRYTLHIYVPSRYSGPGKVILVDNIEPKAERDGGR